MKDFPLASAGSEPLARMGAEDAAKSAAMYASESLSANTLRCYEMQWRLFREWCEANALDYMPATGETVSMYLAVLADEKKKFASIELALAAIQKAHKISNVPKPRDTMIVQETLRGIARRLGTRSQGVDAINPLDLKAMIASFPEKQSWLIRNVRNKAMLLLGFAAAMRRSELVALNNKDIQFVDDGMTILLEKSKTDQTGEGLIKAVPFGDFPATCPVKAVRDWIECELPCRGSGGPSAPLFPAVSPDGSTVLLDVRLNDKTVANIVQAACKRASIGGRYAGHSLRVGLVTTAAKNNMPLHVIMAQTGHTSVQMVMRYIREQQKFAQNAAKGIGL